MVMFAKRTAILTQTHQNAFRLIQKHKQRVLGVLVYLVWIVLQISFASWDEVTCAKVLDWLEVGSWDSCSEVGHIHTPTSLGRFKYTVLPNLLSGEPSTDDLIFSEINVGKLTLLQYLNIINVMYFLNVQSQWQLCKFCECTNFKDFC